MELSLQAAIPAGEDEVPVAPGASVITPMRNGGIVAKNRVESGISFIVPAEIFCPVVDLFLTGGIPGHFAAKGVRLFTPMLSARAHLRFKVCGRVVHPFSFEVGKNLQEDGSFHLAESG